MEMCRGCLSTELHVRTLDESGIHNFNLITNLNIQCTKDRPVFMCEKCLTSLNYCIEFRDKCITSDVKFKEILYQREKLKLDEFQDEPKVEVIKEEYSDDYYDAFIKNEPLNEYDDDDTCLDPAKDDDQLKENTRRSTRKSKTKAKTTKTTKKTSTTTKKTSKLKEIKIEDSETFHCGLCTKICESKEFLIKHIEKVHKSNKVCSLCQLACVSYPHLLAHRMEHLVDKRKECLFCKYKHIIKQPTLEFHYMKVHNLGEKNEKFLCKECSKSYESPNQLYKHMHSVHTEFKFTCDYCFKRFRHKNEMIIHLALHTEEKQYKCDRCDYKCKYLTGLRLHKTRRHLKDRAVCKPCGRVFRTKELMEKHLQKCKHTIKHIVCPICGLTVKQLSRHLNTHSKVPKYKCEKCPASYRTKGALTVHMDKHDGIMKQQCHYCLRRFHARSTLLKHLRTHTGEKPYVCEICTKGFTSNHNLKVHMKVHGITNLIVKRNKEPEEMDELL